MRMADLRPGWKVVTNDGRPFGTVERVGQHYLFVSHSGRGSGLWVPATAIANVDREVVHLNLAKPEAESMGWEQPPRDADEPGGEESDLHRHV